MNFNWITYPKSHHGLSVKDLIQESLKRKEGELAANGALVVKTGKRTGRSPNDRFFVTDGKIQSTIDWGPVNKPLSHEKFENFLEKVTQYLKEREIFVQEGYACANPRQKFPIRIITELAWHALFARQLFLRYAAKEKPAEQPAMTILNAAHFPETFIIINFAKRIILIGGTQYAGEIKKSIFTTLNYLLPEKGILPMHCSANVGAQGDVALFFGLSGTGKTTLSADPNRKLIGDDEHGWDDDGVFNLEGGCYAKCIRLSKELEPQIWNAIKKGAVLENVILDPNTKEPNYDDDSITENTRAAYPIHHIENALVPSLAGHPKVIFFLTADAFGVLPPLSKLNPEEAMYHFLSGYTAKLAGTETGVKDPQATFSNCFGAPFLPRPATLYAKMFGEKLKRHKVPVYLINTGWQGGAYGVGKRISLPYTRAIIHACMEGALEKVSFNPIEKFHLSIPSECPGVPREILDPSQSWKDKGAYNTQATKLSDLFEKNFKRFK